MIYKLLSVVMGDKIAIATTHEFHRGTCIFLSSVF